MYEVITATTAPSCIGQYRTHEEVIYISRNWSTMMLNGWKRFHVPVYHCPAENRGERRGTLVTE